MNLRSAIDALLKPLTVFLLVLCLHGAIALKLDPVVAVDTPVYTKYADLLRNAHYDYSALSRKFRIMVVTRYAFVTFLAFVRDAGGAHWQTLFLILNVLAGAATAALLVSITGAVTRTRAAPLFVLIMFVLCVEVISWSRYVLSDMTYLLLSFATIVFVLRAVIAEPAMKTTSLWIAASVLLILTLLWRPTGVTFIAPVVVGGILSIGARRSRERAETPSRVRAAFLATAAGAFILLLAAAAFLYVPGFRSEAIGVYRAEAARGIVVFDQPRTFHQPPASYLDYVALVGDRFLHFFYFVAPLFSMKHNAYNILFFGPLYVLMLFGLYRACRWDLARPAQNAIILSFVCIASVAVFHAGTEIDFDWRYRLPAIPFMMIVAGSGFASLAATLRKKGRATGALPQQVAE